MGGTFTNDEKASELLFAAQNSAEELLDVRAQQRFGARDLKALLENLEKEIDSTDTLLQDEVEKRKKYQVDDCRRTHNYDEFFCTFLSMLAEQGTLASLVEQHAIGRKRLHRKPGTESPNGRLKRGRPRYPRRR